MAIEASEALAPLIAIVTVLVEIFIKPLQTLWVYVMAYDLFAIMVLLSMLVLTGVVVYYSATGDHRAGG